MRRYGVGSTTQLTDSNGSVTDSYSYDVFGAPRTTTGTTANDFRYTGQQRDGNANRGLYFLRARSYDPALGRFLQKDPLPLGNRYAYAGNNAANVTDPSGLCGVNDPQRYAHPEAAKTPPPSAAPLGSEKPLSTGAAPVGFDACSPPDSFPSMRVHSPFAAVRDFVEGCNWAKLGTGAALIGIGGAAAATTYYLAIQTGGASVIVEEEVAQLGGLGLVTSLDTLGVAGATSGVAVGGPIYLGGAMVISAC